MLRGIKSTHDPKSKYTEHLVGRYNGYFQKTPSLTYAHKTDEI
jgi:hypothetical protein